MTELATLARPYSEAVFKRAKETKTTEKWSKALTYLTQLIKHESVALLTDNPKVNKITLTNLLIDIIGGKVDKEVENFVKLLIHNNRLKLVGMIAQIYEQIKAEVEGYLDVDAITAFPLDKDEQQKLSQVLEHKLNKKIKLNAIIDQSIIGGVLIRAGDTVIDGSVRGQLQKLAKRF